MAGLAQRVFVLLGSRLCASASFLSFPDVGAPPHWPVAASHSLNPANSHSCYQSEDAHKKVSDGPRWEETQSEDRTHDQTGLTGVSRWLKTTPFFFFLGVTLTYLPSFSNVQCSWLVFHTNFKFHHMWKAHSYVSTGKRIKLKTSCLCLWIKPNPTVAVFLLCTDHRPRLQCWLKAAAWGQLSVELNGKSKENGSFPNSLCCLKTFLQSETLLVCSSRHVCAVIAQTNTFIL